MGTSYTHTMNERGRGILKTLTVCLVVNLVIAVLKIVYGNRTGTIAFIADGVHSLFDGAATVMGMVSVYFSSKPPDEGHPYGHQKIETVAAMLLAFLLMVAAYEVAQLAYSRMLAPTDFPKFSWTGVGLIVAAMAVNLLLAKYESLQAKRHSSHLLETDSMHNQSDFLISFAVLGALVAIEFKVPYVDACASILITGWLLYQSVRLVLFNVKPLVDTSVLDPRMVEQIAAGTEGVILCHHIRSRGDKDHYFLDLNIHLPGEISLHKAHEITHEVEHRLKKHFPGLVDVVIHTEPHDHPPCSKD